MLGGCPFIFKSLSLLVLCIMVKRALTRNHKSCGSTLDLSDSHISLAVLLAKLRIITHSGYYIIPYSVIKAIGDSTALHGGPGFPSNYLSPLEALADERPVIFYDQLGCCKSDRPADKSLWRIERFVDELGQLRKALGLRKLHILGHSWGTMLATDYMLTRPTGVAGLILASPSLSTKRWMSDADKLRTGLPKEVQNILLKHERAGTTQAEEYKAAGQIYLQTYSCRLSPRPKELLASRDGMGREVYETMWGPSALYATGNLKDYDRSGRLKEITVPTLFTCGRCGEATPETTAWFQSLLPKSRLVVFEISAHMTMFEEPDRYIGTIRQFLNEVELK